MDIFSYDRYTINYEFKALEDKRGLIVNNSLTADKVLKNFDELFEICCRRDCRRSKNIFLALKKLLKSISVKTSYDIIPYYIYENIFHHMVNLIWLKNIVEGVDRLKF